MEFTFYDVGGRAVAYCDNERYLYAFDGAPLAYVEGDSVYAFDGEHLGWWDRGWIRDHQGACVFFTDAAFGVGPDLPIRQGRPVKVHKQVTRLAAYPLPKPIRLHDASVWSLRSGIQFFPRAR